MYSDDIFKHYLLDEADMEKLIEMWVFFNKKDEPRPLSGTTVYLNKKYSDVSIYQLMQALAPVVFNRIYWLSRFYTMCFAVRTADPMPFMYKYFQEEHLKIVDETRKRSIDKFGDEELEKPAKKTSKTTEKKKKS